MLSGLKINLVFRYIKIEYFVVLQKYKKYLYLTLLHVVKPSAVNPYVVERTVIVESYISSWLHVIQIVKFDRLIIVYNRFKSNISYDDVIDDKKHHCIYAFSMYSFRMNKSSFSCRNEYLL